MRLIGTQALLTLLEQREAAAASAAGVGAGNATVSTLIARIASSTGTGASSFIGGRIISGTASAIGAGSASGIAAVSAAAASAVGTGSASGIVGTEAAAFLNRTSGLDIAHRNAYATLINGLVSDGVWSKLDVLYIFATQNTTTALLNLVSSSFTGTANGSPSFTADRGYTGVDASTTVYINSGFNPTTAPSPQFTTNSCHVSAWADNAVTPTTNGGAVIGHYGTSGTNATNVYPKYNDGKTYFRINDGTQSTGFTNASTSVGHWLASRTGASVSVGYQNGSSFGSPNQAAGTIPNNAIFVLASNANGTPASGSTCQLTMASIGGGLTGTDTTNFYNRLRTYMTVVGVP